jgi:hypothetical protein
MNKLDRMARAIVRQTRTPAQSPRTSSGARVTQKQRASSTRVLAGEVRRLFVPDNSPLNDSSYYLGDFPIGDTSDA